MRRVRGRILAGLPAACLLALASLAATPPPAAPEAPETVISLSGDRISGHITGIGKDGVLRMTNPYFERETGLRIAGLWQATFSSSVREPGPHVVLLTSGDQIAGKVAAISPTEVSVETTVAGKVTIGRAFVAEIRFSPPAGGPPRTDFSAGEIEPFQDLSGANSGGQVRPGQMGPVLLTAEFPQEKALTVLMDFSEGNAPFAVGIFVADAQNFRQNSLVFESTGDNLMIHSRTPAAVGENNLGQIPGKDGVRSARLAYDPMTKELRLWVNGKPAWSGTGSAAPAKGRFVVISCPARMVVSRIQVLEGIAMPTDERKESPRGAGKEEDRDVIMLINGDRLTTEQLTLADGRVAAKAAASDLAIPLDRVDTVSFRNSTRKRPPAHPNSVQVQTGRSTFVLDSVELNDKTATGPSSILGGVIAIDRAALKSLRFGPEVPPPASAGHRRNEPDASGPSIHYETITSP